MCGLAGFIDLRSPPSEAILRTFERCLEHRGPDEGSIRQLGPCGLVHRRLRVIDLSPTASQPMTNEKETLHLVFNGEIYNHHELRKTLMEKGHHFRSQSDSEVILHGYEEWNTGLFEKLNGMFAFGLWDSRQQTLLFARDRFGKKPLFHATGDGWIAFGSCLSLFKHLPQLRPSVSHSGLREFMEFGYIHAPRTILEGVHRLPAAHMALWNSTKLEIRKYWQLKISHTRTTDVDPEQDAARLESHLRSAVKRRLESEVPLGCWLSGGVDSTLITTLAQELSPSALPSFSMHFADADSETERVGKIADRLGTRHHFLQVSARDVLDSFEEILSSCDEPIGDDSLIPTWILSKATRRQLTVTLSGDGGDELFAGYDKYRHFLNARYWQSCFPFLANLNLSALPLSDRWQKSMEALETGTDGSLARWLSSLWKQNELDSLLVQSHDSGSENAFDRIWGENEGLGDIKRFMATDLATYLEGDILAKVDRASMGVALEVRSPFLDFEFVQNVFQEAAHSQIPRGGKSILKSMLKRRIPLEWLPPRKEGFGLPLAGWYRADLKPLLMKYTAPERLRAGGWFQSEYVQNIVQYHMSGKRDFARKLHALVAFEVWHERFFG